MNILKATLRDDIREKSRWILHKLYNLLPIILLILTTILILTPFITTSYANTLVDESVGTYSSYPLENYQLDFYVDTGWDWLPWNWTDGIGKQVMYGLYAITNFIWIISLYLSNATGYLVEQAYTLDFISSTANSIGKNIQTLAGVSTLGFKSDGFYTGFLLIFVLILGIYVSYVGIIKKESSKAIGAVFNFILVFVLSAAFIAYAPDFVKKLNDFSSDISTASLNLGTKMILPNSNIKGKDSTTTIRKTLFLIQVEKPWYLLQYGNSDNTSTDILSISPDENQGKDRENAVKTEIEDNNNQYLTIPKVIQRLGMVFFIFLFNIGITIFVFLLSGIMIFSQILFIIYAMFLPISFLLSMIPGFQSMSKRALMKLFNTIMLRAGITLIVTIAFSLSAMVYTLTSTYPFFLVAFLQVTIFAGIYAKLGDIMSMFSLQSSDSQQMSRNILNRPRRMLSSGSRRLERNIGKSLAKFGIGAGAGIASKNMKSNTKYIGNGLNGYANNFNSNSNTDSLGDSYLDNENVPIHPDYNNMNTHQRDVLNQAGSDMDNELFDYPYNNLSDDNDTKNNMNANSIDSINNMSNTSQSKFHHKRKLKPSKLQSKQSSNGATSYPNHLQQNPPSLSYKAGRVIGSVLDSKQRARANIQYIGQKIKDMPTEIKYLATKPKRDIQSAIENVKDERQRESLSKMDRHNQDIQQKRHILKQEQEYKENLKKQKENENPYKRSYSMEPKTNHSKQSSQKEKSSKSENESDTIDSHRENIKKQNPMDSRKSSKNDEERTGYFMINSNDENEKHHKSIKRYAGKKDKKEVQGNKEIDMKDDVKEDNKKDVKD